MQDRTAEWVEDFVSAARKNFPKHTMRPLISGVSKVDAVKRLTKAGMAFHCTNFRGNRAITVTGETGKRESGA